MSLSFLLALRYLFSKKSHNAINIISSISMGGITLATMALVCTLSVFNGFREVVEGLYTAFDPQLKVIPAKGKFISDNDSVLLQIRQHQEVASASNILQDYALILFEGHPLVVELKGVEDNFAQTIPINTILRGQGDTLLLKDNDTFYGIAGLPLARYISGTNDFGVLQMCAPKQGERINVANPTESFNVDYLKSSGQVFIVNQEKYDNNYIITHIDFTQNLFEKEGQISSLELRLNDKANINKVQRELKYIAGEHFIIQNQTEQQSDVYNVMEIEKLMSYFFLTFILLVATFNIIGSLSMLIIDKRKDMATLNNLGATPTMIRRIFIIEGCLIALIGATVGVVLGCLLCLGQQYFGWLRFDNGDGTFLLDYYPVSVELLDILMIIGTVFFVSCVSIWWPIRYLTRRLL